MSEETKTESKVTAVTTIKGNVSAGVSPRSNERVEKTLQVVGTPQAAIDVAPVQPSGGEPTVTPATSAKEAPVSKLI